MLLNVDFVVVFSSLLNSFFFNKRYLNYLNYYDLNNLFISKKEFYKIYYIIIKFYKLYYYDNIMDFNFIKNYKIYYIIEFYIKFNNIFLKKWWFLNFINNNHKLYLFSNFKLKINIILFFTLGKYVEFLRLFFYNEYIMSLNLFEVIDIRYYKNIFKNKIYFYNNFRKLISQGVYLFYYKELNNIKSFNFSLVNIRDNNLIFINKIFNKYLKYYFFFSRILLLLFFFFFDYLRSYYILFSYKYWKIYGQYFVFLSKVPISSIFILYKCLSKIQAQVDYYFIYFTINYLNKKINNLLFQNNLDLLLWRNNFSLININNDVIVINYISTLYYKLSNSLFLIENFKMKFDFLTFWDIIENWYHFDYVLLPKFHNSSNELFLWLSLFKNNLEIFIWQIFNKNILNKYFLNDFMCVWNFINVDIKYNFINLVFFEILCNYFFKYCLKYFYFSKLIFVYNYFYDYFIKLYIYNLNLVNSNDVNNLSYLRIKQFKHFYYNFLYKNRYIKIYNFYIKNINFY